ncbi:MAG TPA: sulfotransferase [Acidimicrobiales bacterium]|nr:sulfotransferase [Acidimicrobiales bacterium]
MGMAPMGDRYRRPDWVRRMNAMGSAAGGARDLVPLDASAMIDAVRASTGIADPGDLGDGDWEGRLQALTAAIDGGDLHVVGRLMTREELMRGLRTRFLLGEQRRGDPSVAHEAIEAPIVVTGPARSGTTILFELLGLDSGLRTPVATDVLHPVPAPGVDSAARFAMTESEQEFWADVQPEFAAIHELGSDLPVECITICAPSFAGNHWSMVLADPGEWTADIGADLAFHRAVLQSAQHGRPPRRWLLKTPGWLFLLDDLLAAYPDASVIVSHRDPARTMPSTVSTTATVQWLRTDAVDLDVLSALIGAMFGDALNTLARRRDDGSLPGVFGDVRFHELMDDPVAAIAGAYEGIGREMTDEHRAAVIRYLDGKPRGKHGAHRYTAADWGFDADVLRAELAPYMSRFGVAVEPA